VAGALAAVAVHTGLAAVAVADTLMASFQ